jgi:hypothetical protein
MPISLRRSKIKIVTWARLLFHAFCCFIALMCCSSWFGGMCGQSDLKVTSASQDEIKGQLLSIRRRLDRGEDRTQLMAVPEGQLFVHSFYGYALVNIALESPPGSEPRRRACTELEDLLTRIDKIKHQFPFTLNAKLKPSGGIIIAGHSNLLRAGYLALGGNNPQIKHDFDVGSEEIANSILNGKVPFPECYPGYTWAEDSIFALESLRLHDVLCHSDYSRARNAWLSWLKSHIDPESGMMVTQIDVKTGQVIDGPRGSAISWALGFLPYSDPQFAHEQFSRFRKNWFVPFAGMLGINEWYHGVPHETAFPSGPVAFGLSEAATGIGIGACRANGDYHSWHLILRALNTMALPVWTPTGERNFFWGQCMLADSLAVWGETARRWDADVKPNSTYAASDYAAKESQYYAVMFVVACFSFVVIWMLGHQTLDSFKNKTAVRPGWRPITIIAFVLQFFAVVALFSTSAFCWPVLLIYMLVVDVLEQIALRARKVGVNSGSPVELHS